MNSFQVFLLGFTVLVVGLAAAAYLLGVPTLWIAIGVIILIGLGIMGASNRSEPGSGAGPPRY
jgi:hypothetical protein